jgi:methylenetetrahydrofolate reductase (NADPH)
MHRLRRVSFREALASGAFVVTAELGPPASADPAAVRAKARALAGVVHAANVTDNQAATVKMSALAASALVLDEGLEPVLQLTGRDRNLLALQSELLGAWALGVRSVLTLGGDPLSVGLYDGLATSVADRNGTGLAALVGELNAGRLAAGEAIDPPTDFLVVGAANPFRDTADWLGAKIDAGVRCFQTNVVYDLERFRPWFDELVAAGVPQRAPFLIGVMPPRSTRMLRHMHDNIPGVDVDEATFGRMKGLEGHAAADAGIAIAAELVDGWRAVDGVAGVHLMAPGWEAEAVPRIVRSAGLSAIVGDV